MCQMCIEDPKCGCHLNCQITVTRGQKKGEKRTRCIVCNHSVQC